MEKLFWNVSTGRCLCNLPASFPDLRTDKPVQSQGGCRVRVRAPRQEPRNHTQAHAAFIPGAARWKMAPGRFPPAEQWKLVQVKDLRARSRRIFYLPLSVLKLNIPGQKKRKPKVMKSPVTYTV